MEVDGEPTHDKVKLHHVGQDGKVSTSYGTLQEMKVMEEDTDDEPPRPPLTLPQLGLGLGLVGVFVACGALTAPCLVHLGRNVVPTLELVALSYAIQTLCLVPAVALRWQVFRQVTEDQIVWLLATGMTISLALMCTYQAALTLPGSVVAAMGLAGLLIFTFLLTLVLDCQPRHVYSLICLVSFLGLILMLVSSAKNAYRKGWMPVVSRSLGEVEEDTRSGTETDQGASMQSETATLDPGDIGAGEETGGSDGGGDAGAMGYDPSSVMMYAYCTMILAAFLGTVGCILVHRRLHSLPMIPFLFWLALVGTVLAILEMALFTSPSWPGPDKALPFVGFLFLFNAAILALHVTWRIIPPTLFSMVSGLSVVLYLIIQYAAPGFATLMPVDGPYAMEIVGAILVSAAAVAGPLWLVRTIRMESQEALNTGQK